MKTSLYTPWGFLKHVGGIPIAQRLHEQAKLLVTNAKRGMTVEDGSFLDDVTFATSMMVAQAAGKILRAGDQRFAAKVYDSIDRMEHEHGIIPDPGANVPTRWRALSARKLAPTGASRPAVEEALRKLLGAAYVGIHITQPVEALLWPVEIGDQPMNLQLPEEEKKLIKIPSGITIKLNVPQEVIYTPVDPLPDPTSFFYQHVLRVGEQVVIEPEIEACTETVTILGLSLVALVGDENSGAAPAFTAVFTRGHGTDCWGSTGTYPSWTSTQREIVVIVKSTASVNIEMRRQVHELLERQVPGVTTWALVAESAANQAGPFTLDDPALGMLDVTPLDLVPPP